MDYCFSTASTASMAGLQSSLRHTHYQESIVISCRDNCTQTWQLMLPACRVFVVSVFLCRLRSLCSNATCALQFTCSILCRRLCKTDRTQKSGCSSSCCTCSPQIRSLATVVERNTRLHVQQSGKAYQSLLLGHQS